MNDYFCHNKECKNHRMVHQHVLDYGMRVVDDLYLQTEKHYQRHIYVSKLGVKPLYLCDTCAGAAKAVSEYLRPEATK